MAEDTRKFPTRAVIGGRSFDAADGKTFATLNPATGQPLARIAECAAVDVDKAVAAAREAFDNGPWPRMSPAERKTVLQRFAAVIEANAEELAELEALEAGKPISDALGIDLPETVATLRWHAEAETRSTTRFLRRIPVTCR